MAEKLDLEQKLAELYAQGRSHYEAGRWLEALECFRQLQGLGGNYKQVNLIVAALEKRLATQQPQDRMATLYREAQAALDEGDWATAITRLQAMLDLDPTHEGAAAKLRQAKRQHWASLYAQGRNHYEAGHGREALEVFRQIQASAGDFRDVGTLMAAIEESLAREQASRAIGAMWASQPTRATAPARAPQPPQATPAQRQSPSIAGQPLWVVVPALLALLLLVGGGGYWVYAALNRPPVATPTPASPPALAPETPAASAQPPFGTLTAPPTLISAPTPLPPTETPVPLAPKETPTPTRTQTFTLTPTPTPTPTFTRAPYLLTLEPTLTFTPVPPTEALVPLALTATPTPPTPTFTPVTPTEALAPLALTATPTPTPTPTFTPLPPTKTLTSVPTPTLTPTPTTESTLAFTPTTMPTKGPSPTPAPTDTPEKPGNPHK